MAWPSSSTRRRRVLAATAALAGVVAVALALAAPSSGGDAGVLPADELHAGRRSLDRVPALDSPPVPAGATVSCPDTRRPAAGRGQRLRARRRRAAAAGRDPLHARPRDRPDQRRQRVLLRHQPVRTPPRRSGPASAASRSPGRRVGHGRQARPRACGRARWPCSRRARRRPATAAGAASGWCAAPPASCSTATGRRRRASCGTSSDPSARRARVRARVRTGASVGDRERVTLQFLAVCAR